MCIFKLIFNDLILKFKIKKMYNVKCFFSLRPYLIKIESFTRQGFKFSHTSKIKITFKTNFNNMTIK